MKYYSDVTMKIYNSEKELKEAEAEFNKKTTKSDNCNCKQSQDKCISKTPSRKQLATDVENAEARVEEAKSKLEIAKQHAQELSKKYLEEIDAIMEPAKKELKEAQKHRYEAIKKFNDAYGVYTSTYTGAKAAEEFARAVSDMTSFFPSFFRY